jgi:2-oxo-4-hydroxy-4-carboxy--5-ureidoimidazoline (OHCU) decarboxylase
MDGEEDEESWLVARKFILFLRMVHCLYYHSWQLRALLASMGSTATRLALTDDRLDMVAINRAGDAAAAAMILPFVERAPDLAGRIASRRPFDGPAALAEAVRLEITALEGQELMTFLRNHPELAPTRPEDMTMASQREQARLALTAPTAGIAARLAELNRRYDEKFAFPFIIALHRHADLDSVLSDFEHRLDATRGAEIATARDEIISVASARIESAFGPARGGTL